MNEWKGMELELLAQNAQLDFQVLSNLDMVALQASNF
jgi:hypothetical protein